MSVGEDQRILNVGGTGRIGIDETIKANVDHPTFPSGEIPSSFCPSSANPSASP
jgi:putative NADH-flavin reductase